MIRLGTKGLIQQLHGINQAPQYSNYIKQKYVKFLLILMASFLLLLVASSSVWIIFSGTNRPVCLLRAWVIRTIFFCYYQSVCVLCNTTVQRISVRDFSVVQSTKKYRLQWWEYSKHCENLPYLWGDSQKTIIESLVNLVNDRALKHYSILPHSPGCYFKSSIHTERLFYRVYNYVTALSYIPLLTVFPNSSSFT